MSARYTVLTMHNAAVLPIVLFVRIPLLLPLWALIRAGEGAAVVFDALHGALPGFERRRRPNP